MMPLLPLYGDLEDDETFDLLVGDVCRLVENNPVPWEGIEHFDQGEVAERCRERSLVAIYRPLFSAFSAPLRPPRLTTALRKELPKHPLHLPTHLLNGE